MVSGEDANGPREPECVGARWLCTTDEARKGIGSEEEESGGEEGAEEETRVTIMDPLLPPFRFAINGDGFFLLFPARTSPLLSTHS